jgi:hypothetical protein
LIPLRGATRARTWMMSHRPMSTRGWRRSSRRCRVTVGVRAEECRKGRCARKSIDCLCIRRVSHPGGTPMYSYRPSLSHHSSGQATKAVIIRRVSPNRCPTLPHHRHCSLTRPRHKVPTTRACSLGHASCLQVISSCMLQYTCSSSRAYRMTENDC